MLAESPGGADTHHAVALATQRTQLAHINLVIAKIVGHGRENGRIGGQSQGVELVVHLEATHQFGCNVLAVGRAAAVAAKEDTTPAGQGLNQHLAAGFDLIGQLEHLLAQLDALLQGLTNQVLIQNSLTKEQNHQLVVLSDRSGSGLPAALFHPRNQALVSHFSEHDTRKHELAVYSLGAALRSGSG